MPGTLTCNGADQVKATQARLNGQIAGAPTGQWQRFQVYEAGTNNLVYDSSGHQTTGNDPEVFEHVVPYDDGALQPSTNYEFVISETDGPNGNILQSSTRCAFTTAATNEWIECVTSQTGIPSPIPRNRNAIQLRVAEIDGLPVTDQAQTGKGNLRWLIEVATSPTGPWTSAGILTDGNDNADNPAGLYRANPDNTYFIPGTPGFYPDQRGQLVNIIGLSDDGSRLPVDTEIYTRTSIFFENDPGVILDEATCSVRTDSIPEIDCGTQNFVTDNTANFTFAIGGNTDPAVASPALNGRDRVAIEVSTSPTGPWTQAGTYDQASGRLLGVQHTSFTVNMSGLQPGTTYHYRTVLTENATGGAGTPTVLRTGTPCPQTFTTTGQQQESVSMDCGGVTTTTSGATIPVSVTGASSGDRVQLRYGTTQGGPYTDLGGPLPVPGTGAQTFDYTVSGLQPNTQYCGQLEMVDSGGAVIATSAECCFTTQANQIVTPPSTPGSNCTEWTATAPSNHTAQVYESVNNGPWTGIGTVQVFIGATETRTWTVAAPSGSPGDTIRRRVRVFDSGNNLVQESDICTSTIPNNGGGSVSSDCEPRCGPGRTIAQTKPACDPNPCASGGGSGGPVSLDRGNDCTAPLHVEVCNPSVQPVEIIRDSENLGCTVDQQGAVTGRVFARFDENNQMVMVRVDTAGNVTDPYTGPWEACAGDNGARLVISEVLGCADGVPWSRRHFQSYDANTGAPLGNGQNFYVDSDGNTQLTPPANFTLGACQPDADCATVQQMIDHVDEVLRLDVIKVGSTAGRLEYMDLISGTVYHAGTTGYPSANAGALNQATGTYYHLSSGGDLYEWDINNLAAGGTQITLSGGTIPNNENYGAFDPTTGLLYFGYRQGFRRRVDPTTGIVETLPGLTGIASGDAIGSVAIDRNGQMYAFTSGGTQSVVYRVDKETGNAVAIGTVANTTSVNGAGMDTSTGQEGFVGVNGNNGDVLWWRDEDGSDAQVVANTTGGNTLDVVNIEFERSNTCFLRCFTFDSTGTPTLTDYDVNGQPYTVRGEAVLCLDSDNTEQPDAMNGRWQTESVVEEGCADGVPWSRVTSTSTDTRTGDEDTSRRAVMYIDSDGNAQAARPTNFILGPCAVAGRDVEIATIPGCADGVAWYAIVRIPYNPQTGQPVDAEIVTTYFDQNGNTQTTPPANWFPGECRARYQTIVMDVQSQANGGIGNLNLDFRDPNNPYGQIVSITVRNRNSPNATFMTETSDGFAVPAGDLPLDPGESITFGGVEENRGTIHDLFRIRPGDGVVRVTMVARKYTP